MKYSKTIVCLANSRKPGGRCVAGKEIIPKGYGNWIRPVSARPSAEIADDESQYENGGNLHLLDIVEIPMLASVPHLHQTENHMIDAAYYWKKKGTVKWDDLNDLVDEPSTLWGNGDSTYHGRNDRVRHSAVAEYRNSLWLVKPENVTIHILVPGADFGNPKRAARADFMYAGTQYNLKVTDPVSEQAFLAEENGEYGLDEDIYFCISLAEVHTDGYCYKLVAGIFSEDSLKLR